MTRSDIYVLKGHIETERQKFFFRKLRGILRDTCLLGALGISRVAKFSPGEIIPCEIVPGRNFPPPCTFFSLQCSCSAKVRYGPLRIVPHRGRPSFGDCPSWGPGDTVACLRGTVRGGGGYLIYCITM